MVLVTQEPNDNADVPQPFLSPQPQPTVKIKGGNDSLNKQ